jgi:murein DD-endopeptidase MepM/ murein hydrolase activator NlpD
MNPRVQVDEYVERGQFIAYSGNSGNSMVPHLHFEAWAPDENGDFNQALRVHFVDVEGDGVPRAYNTYTSQNHLGNGNCYGDSGLVSE